jgi:predicted CopG family antitoxin
MATTTIQIRFETKEMLDKIKVHARETYDDVITRLALKAMKKVIQE